MVEILTELLEISGNRQTSKHMDIFAYIFFGVLCLLGLILLFFFGKTLLQPTFAWIFEKQKSKGLEKLFVQLEAFDQLIKEEKFSEALKALGNAISYDLLSGSELINQLKRHYQNILSRAVILADEQEIEIEYLAETEHLLLERIDLLLLNDNVSTTYSRVQSKREQLGKDVPEWTKEDFQKRLNEVKHELAENKLALTSSFKRMLDSLSSATQEKTKKDDEPITYH